jgi:hypothetical protein
LVPYWSGWNFCIELVELIPLFFFFYPFFLKFFFLLEDCFFISVSSETQFHWFHMVWSEMYAII